MLLRRWLSIVGVVVLTLTSGCGEGKIKPDEDAQRRTDAAAHADIGEIIITNREARRAIESDTISLPNCQGSRVLEVSRPISKEVSRQVELISTDRPLPVSEGVIIDAVQTLFNTKEEDTLTGSVTVKLKAEPGMTATYTVDWTALGVAGVVEATSDGKRYFVEFWLPTELEAELSEPDERACQGG